MPTPDELLAMIRALQGRANALEVRAGAIESDVANLRRQADAADAAIAEDRMQRERQAHILRRRE